MQFRLGFGCSDAIAMPPAFRIVQIDKQTGDGLCIAFYDDKEAAKKDRPSWYDTERYKHVIEKNENPTFHKQSK